MKFNKTEKKKKNETKEDGGLDIWHGMQDLEAILPGY